MTIRATMNDGAFLAFAGRTNASVAGPLQDATWQLLETCGVLPPSKAHH
jgi:hypothetical protein